ncbi:hypothetical protein NR798_38015 [Archangium gephyra]|uniref:hypothetical protein n=1 Tax=Archangium gephyra TaxID=48 RepID=UPI0035D475E9
MRSHPLLSRFSLLLALLASSGCNTAYREAMAQAREAAIRGDFLTAARAYRTACAAAPDDKDACGRFPIFAQKATDQALESARPPCEAGELDRCLPPLLDAKDLIPGHAEVNTLLEKASQLHVERCAKWQADGPVATAVAGLACLQSRGHQLPVPSYQTLLSERAAQLASRFANLATTARGEGSHGASSVLMSAAQCLAPAPQTASRVNQARQSFLEQSAIPVMTHLEGSMAPRIAQGLSDLCERMSSQLPSWARCASTGTRPGQPDVFQVWVDALIQRAVQTVSEDVRNLDYVSGTRQVDNPEYGRAEERVSSAESALAGAEKRKKDKEAECEEAKHTHEASCVGCPEPSSNKKKVCDEASDAASDYSSAQSELSAARKHLSNTPATVTEDVYDTFTYSVWTYQWSSSYRFRLQSSTPSAEPAQGAGALRFQDQEHVGFRPGGLSPDPLVVPSDQAYADAFVAQLTPYVVAAVKRDAEARGAWRRNQCGALPADWSTPWVQCWAESALWASGKEPQASEFLNLLASSASASSPPLCR